MSEFHGFNSGSIGGGGGGSTGPEALREIAVTRSGSGGAGTTDSATKIEGRGRLLRVEVLAAFDAGATAKVGTATDDDQFAGAADLDAAFMATLNAVKLFNVDSAVDVAGEALRVTTVGASTQGSLKATLSYSTPEV